MDRIDNIIANEKYKLKSNANDSLKHLKVDWIADRLVETFKSPQSREFYCSVAYKLSEETINRLKADVLERKNIRNLAAYFNTVATKEMAKYPRQKP